jgi:hypothetical protein
MFTSEQQRSEVCRTLLEAVYRGDLWDHTGPTDAALDLLEADGGPLSSGERVMLKIAFDVWNGGGNATMSGAFYTLDQSRRTVVADLMLALDDGRQIDDWLARYAQ